MKQAEDSAKQPIAVEVIAGKVYLWCACGKSQTQPWCDGSHAGSDKAPLTFTAKETATIYLCGCKHSGHAPFCDGTHQFLNGGGRDQYFQDGQTD